MGNSTIKEIKGLVLTKDNLNKSKIEINNKDINKLKIKINNRDINKLKRVLKKDVNNFKNQREFEKLKNEIENTR